MSFDSFTLHLLVSELRDAILDGRIRHVAQTNSFEIILRISTEHGSRNLLISAHPTHARTHLVKQVPKTEERFHFADFLMRHIMRGTITSIEQIGLDRILQIQISPIQSVIEVESKLLIAEFMGKHSNIILVNESTGKILESIKHIDESMSRYRQVLPGLEYMLPPQQQKLDPFSLGKSQFLSLFEDNTKKQTWRVLLTNIDGMSPMIAKEIVARAGVDDTPEALWEAFKEVLDVFKSPRPPLIKGEQIGAHSPQVHVSATDETDVIAASALPLMQFPEMKRLPFESMSEALEYFYQCVILKENIAIQRNALTQTLNKKRAAAENKLTALSEDLHTAENADDIRIKGELIISNLHKIKRGQTEVEVENYYDPNLTKLAIELDPRLSPSDNAQRYFKRYSKAKRSKAVISNLIAENQALLEVIEHYTAELERAKNLPQLLAIRSELVERGWSYSNEKKKRKKKEGDATFRNYLSSDGYQIYVGRNSKENDLLITRIAKKDDMWLHAKHIFGSHVIIRNPEKKPGIPMPTLLEAAQIAAYFSKASKSSHVPVDYTWAKFVVKPKGSKPGFVTYTREKTLYVEPRKPTNLRFYT
ncbi:TPA: fibronectin/fibrinogen-binding protein [Candidatus Poribacteria bacterium]|nr:fibronectin/fibrinogen-binding protein [Candidatus Poribacteria bacterium]